MAERRHEPRIHTMNLVHVEEYSFQTLTDFKTGDAMGKTIDLSHDGMRLELDHCIPLRSRVELELALGEQILKLHGRVRSVVEVDSHVCDHGIEFVDVTTEQYEALEEHLQLRGED
jgi:hypothetical protein